MVKLEILRESDNKKTTKQKWFLHIDDKVTQYSIDVTLGKPIDILSLKNKSNRSFKSKIEQLGGERVNLFKNRDLSVNSCPVCNSFSKKQKLEVYNGLYVQCENCDHLYVSNRLSKIELEKFYSESLAYQSTYSNKEEALKRLHEIHMPKLKYVLEKFEAMYGRKPKRILDIGAGSGHFGKACEIESIEYLGIELSQSGVQFAKEYFNVELLNLDILQNYQQIPGDFDVVTFWGLIEHVPNPIEMLEVGKLFLKDNPENMVFASVPRWNSGSSMIQRVYPNQIIRHLDPLGHIQMFTEKSISLLCEKSGINLKSLWYYGMDAYEIVLNLSLISESEKIIDGNLIESFQEFFDLNGLSDWVILSGKF